MLNQVNEVDQFYWQPVSLLWFHTHLIDRSRPWIQEDMNIDFDVLSFVRCFDR